MDERDERIRLPGQYESLTAVGASFLTLTLVEWGLGLLTDALSLAASEVLTNAVLHARTPIEVAMHLSEQLVVSVHDESPPWLTEPTDAAQTALPDWDSEGGRGLPLIEAVTDAWGVRPEPPGKTVWFSLLPPPHLARRRG